MKIKAKESNHITKARQKLKIQLEQTDKQLTDQALKRIRKSMHNWIARHAPERISLKSKEIKLFDENQHPATIENKFILNKLKNLKTKVKSNMTPTPLTGRIKQSS